MSIRYSIEESSIIILYCVNCKFSILSAPPCGNHMLLPQCTVHCNTVNSEWIRKKQVLHNMIITIIIIIIIIIIIVNCHQNSFPMMLEALESYV